MADSFAPPQEVKANAKRGLELRAKHGRGGTDVGVARARDLSNGTNISLDTIKRMNSYFARHEVDKKGEGWGTDSAGYIAWLLWGGDAGWTWAKSILREQEKKDKSTMNELAHSYAAILKSEKQDDGTLKVYGKATDDTVDIDQQICDEDWLKRAMPDWFTTGGNVREQHSNIAAGVATNYEAKADGHYITALVVDPVSVKKVETGVLKGFSIGIRGPRVIRDAKAAGGRIVDGQIVEVSLVDRPANPNAKLMLAKAADNGELVNVAQVSIPSPADIARTISKSDDVVETVEAVVEEVVETVEAIVEEVADTIETVVEEVAEETAPLDDAVELVNTAKSFLATLTKFDQATYDEARRALAELIIVEANEMAATGSNEKDSIEELLDSVKHLFRWYEGEVAEGEVANPVGVDVDVNDDYAEVETLMAKDAIACECECDKCSDKAADGCKSDSCKCGNYKSAEPDTEGTPADTAEDLEKSIPAEQETVAIDETVVAGIVEKAVAQAKASVESELDLLKSAIKAEQEKATELAAALETANKAAVTGGPKRSRVNATNLDAVELNRKAAVYSAKAAATTDTLLAKGYRELAEELTTKATKIAGKDIL